MILRNIFLLLVTMALTGCLATYPVVKESESAAFIKFERNMGAPLLGSITRYVKVDEKQQCREGYADQELLAVQNKGNPLVSDLNLNGLYVNPGHFRILINTVAGNLGWCDVFVEMDIKAGEKYRIVANGNVSSGRGFCSAVLFKQTTQGPYEKSEFKKYFECNK